MPDIAPAMAGAAVVAPPTLHISLLTSMGLNQVPPILNNKFTVDQNYQTVNKDTTAR